MEVTQLQTTGISMEKKASITVSTKSIKKQEKSVHENHVKELYKELFSKGGEHTFVPIANKRKIK